MNALSLMFEEKMTMLMEGRFQGEFAVIDAAQRAYVRKGSNCWHVFQGQCTPSREDGISPMDEASLRKSYCVFAQNLGKQLKLPQVTIATAIIYCHCFFLRQSHARNDRFIIAAACLFLAGKVKETPERLYNVIIASFDLRISDNPEAASKIKKKETYEEKRGLLLSAERLVLVTLDFDINIAHPYKPLIDAIKHLPQPNSLLQQLAQIAWNFVNDGLQTTLCLQFEPGHVAAGALYLAAKFLRIKCGCDWETLLSKELNISFQRLEDVSNHILESYGSLIESAHKLGISKVIRVPHKEGPAVNEALPASMQLSPTITPPVTTYVDWDDWPLYPNKTRKESREVQFDFENSRSHTLQSDLTEERSSFYEESDWAFDRRHLELSRSPAEHEDGGQACGRRQSQHTPSMDEDREARSLGKSWLGCKERNLRRLCRHVYPAGTNCRGKDGTAMRSGRVWIGGRDKGIRNIMGRRGFLQTLPGSQKKALTRRDFLLWLTNRKSVNKLHTSMDLESRLKLAQCQPQRKVEIITQPYGQKARVRG